MRIKVEVEGLQKAMKQSEQFAAKVKSRLGPIVLEGADIIRDAARGRITRSSIGGVLERGELAAGIKSEITWDKNASKAFAGAGMDKNKNNRFVYHTKGGTRYYIPSAVEYGHRAPGGGGYVVLATDKAGNILQYTRGRKKGRARIAASSKQNKVAKPHSFMRWAYKNKKDVVRLHIQSRLAALVKGAGG